LETASNGPKSDSDIAVSVWLKIILAIFIPFPKLESVHARWAALFFFMNAARLVPPARVLVVHPLRLDTPTENLVGTAFNPDHKPLAVALDILQLV
jgi:hypothetical protein